MILAHAVVLPVAVPLLTAALLLCAGSVLPRRLPDVLAIAVAAFCALCCGVLAERSVRAPIVEWFGGWTPRGGQPIGIAFVVTPAGGWIASFIAALFTATLVFSWGFFRRTSSHFHLLMLLFMAGQIGFCLTHDLFNLFVWFELMSVAAFALTGYALRSSALAGALNFTVVNTIGAYLILAGIGLAYGRTGALDFGGIARGAAAMPADPVLVASFSLLATGLLVKGAQVPFQFWLPDAHSVAHSPVSVIFSGAMVAIALFGIAELYWSAFAVVPTVRALMHGVMLGMGVASAALGGVMALLQRHFKRLLAFSTVSHAGIVLVGFALLDGNGTAGALVYLVGHGLVKASLFMGAGILLASLGGVDEIGLRGAGRRIWPAGIAMAAGGLLLAGLPVGVMDCGLERIWSAARAAGSWPAEIAITVGLACTGAAVLRVAGRVFAGLGPVAGEEERSPTENEREDADRPLWLMLLPVLLLLVLAVPLAHQADRDGWLAAAALMHPQTDAVLGLAPLRPVAGPAWRPAPQSLLPWGATAAALLLAALELFWHKLPRGLARGYDRVFGPVLGGLGALQSGKVADYVAWIAVGLVVFAAAAVVG